MVVFRVLSYCFLCGIHTIEPNSDRQRSIAKEMK